MFFCYLVLWIFAVILSFFQVLAAGMSGLYSMLPRSFPIETEEWCRISDQDIQDIPHLQMFLSSLQFCNAVVQVSLIHSDILPDEILLIL